MTHQPPILALDIGAKRTGVALNPTGSVILELETVSYPNHEEFQLRMAELNTIHQPRAVVVGRPRDSEGEVAQLIKLLEQLPASPPLIYLDEALTTKEAERQLATEGRVGDSDARAARLILEQFISQDRHPE